MARWEYQTLKFDVAGFFGPDVRPETLDEALNALGAQGWELSSAFDVNRGHGRTSEIVAVFKRSR